MDRSKLRAERLHWINIRRRPSKCIGCPLHPRTPGFDPLSGGAHVPPKRASGALLLVAAIVPGEEEEVRGEPLTGPTGRWIERSLQFDGELPMCKLNIVNCRATKLGLQGRIVNRTKVTAAEYHFCMERFFLPEVAKFAPGKIFILGTDAYKIGVEEAFGKFGIAIGHRLPFPRSFFSSDLKLRRVWAKQNRGDIV